MATETKVFNMAGGKHSAEAYSSFEGLLYGSSVASGFTVTKSSSNMNCFIDSGAGLIKVGSTYARRIAIEGGTLTATVSAASTTLARRDTIVLYVDNSVTPSTSVLDNTNGILKSMVVAGTPAQTPSAPNATTIQSAVGAGNPYIILYDILVPANATNLSTATLYDRRNMAADSLVGSATNGAIPGSKLTDASVTASKIDWSSIFAKIQYAGSAFTTTSSTMADKITMTGVPKGRYLIQGMTSWSAGSTDANGECNMRFAITSGGTTTNTDTNTVFMPPTGAAQWSGISNVYQAMVNIGSDNSTIKLQTSVNWPTRGTFTCRATSYISAIRIGEATS